MMLQAVGGDFEAVAALTVGTGSVEVVGVRMKANTYAWCLLKALIACSKILPTTRFTSCLKLLVK